MVTTAVRTSGPAAADRAAAAHNKMSARKVNLWYGEKQALFDVDLDIAERQVTALIGPSGCGKSTFLRCLNRMNDIIEGCRVEGDIRLEGDDIYDRSVDVVQLRAKIGMVFQKPNPFPKSIYENIAYGPRIHGLAANKSEMDEIVESSLKGAGLWNEVKDRLAEPGNSLSGGQQQRLCIARAIAVSPEVILMDEPCSALDPIATAHIEELIDELRAELHDRDRHPQHAAGGAGVAEHRVLPSRQADRVRRHRADLHQSEAVDDPGLHHRPLRLSAPDRSHGDRPHRQVLRPAAHAADPQDPRDGRPGRAADRRARSKRWSTATSSSAERVIEQDDQIDRMEEEIDQHAIRLLATRQPMAIDLRLITMAMKIANDLERIGDYATNIAKRSERLAGRRRSSRCTRSRAWR